MRCCCKRKRGKKIASPAPSQIIDEFARSKYHQNVPYDQAFSIENDIFIASHSSLAVAPPPPAEPIPDDILHRYSKKKKKNKNKNKSKKKGLRKKSHSKSPQIGSINEESEIIMEEGAANKHALNVVPMEYMQANALPQNTDDDLPVFYATNEFEPAFVEQVDVEVDVGGDMEAVVEMQEAVKLEANNNTQESEKDRAEKIQDWDEEEEEEEVEDQEEELDDEEEEEVEDEDEDESDEDEDGDGDEEEVNDLLMPIDDDGKAGGSLQRRGIPMHFVIAKNSGSMSISAKFAIPEMEIDPE